MRLHVASLAGQPTTVENSVCAYSNKVRRFCTMMTEHGHEVFLYSTSETDAQVTEHIPCYPTLDHAPPFEIVDPDWMNANARAIPEIINRRQEEDLLCVIAGGCQKMLADAVELLTVEFGVGYSGVFSQFRVFESYAWMHAMYGALGGDAARSDGKFYDAVIPNYFDVSEFEFKESNDGEYLLYVGRLIERKGVEVAVETAKRTGRKLLLAGAGEYRPGDGEPNIEYLGPVGPQARSELMGNALALLAPTIYVEPFGGAVVEAQLCGTPAITTDWGAFTETVENGVNGFRCHALASFAQAVDGVADLDRQIISDRAVDLYSTDVVAPQYERYFERLQTLRGDGWYS